MFMKFHLCFDLFLCQQFSILIFLLKIASALVTLLLAEMMERPYYMDYSPARLVIHKMVTSKYFDLAISAVIGLNVITMAMEFYMMPEVT